jgi:hypothetical protein
MSFLISLLPATIFVVIGYFVIYSSAKSEGGVKRFGQILGAWLLFLGAATVLGGTLGPMFGLRGPMGGAGGMFQHMSRMESLEEEQLTILRELQGN